MAKETKIGGLSLIDANPETLKFRMNQKTRSVLGTNQFLFTDSELTEEEEEYDFLEDGPLHSITTGYKAANSITRLREGRQNLEHMTSTLNAVESRLVSKKKKFALDGEAGYRLRSATQAVNMALEVTSTIFDEAQSALAVHDEYQLRDLKTLLLG